MVWCRVSIPFPSLTTYYTFKFVNNLAQNVLKVAAFRFQHLQKGIKCNAAHYLKCISFFLTYAEINNFSKRGVCLILNLKCSCIYSIFTYTVNNEMDLPMIFHLDKTVAQEENILVETLLDTLVR